MKGLFIFRQIPILHVWNFQLLVGKYAMINGMKAAEKDTRDKLPKIFIDVLSFGKF